jgi:glutathione S-transferase
LTALIEVYNYPLSPCGEKVRFALAEKQLSWTDHHVDLGAKENLRPDFLRFNPKGLVPVLRLGADVIAESTIIIEFIDDRWAEPSLRPDDPLARARMRRWTKLVDEVLHPAWPGIAWPILVRPAWQAKSAETVEAMLAALPDPRRREKQSRLYQLGLNAPDAQESLTVFATVCREMEEALNAGPWISGESFSLGDIALLPYFVALEAFSLERLFATYSRITDWYSRACARPAYGGHPRTLLPPVRLAEVAQYGRAASAALKPSPAHP